MIHDSVFYKLVRDENSYTQLLCNLLRRSQELRHRFAALFVPEKYAGLITRDQVRPQTILPECGIPDIVVQNQQLSLLVEVKVTASRGLTCNQEVIGTAGRESGYLKFLLGTSSAHRCLGFLVPRDWAYGEELQRALNEATEVYRVAFKVRYWDEVVNEIHTVLATAHDPFLEEFRVLLAERFGPMSFVGQELTMLFTKEFPIRAVRKLDILVEELADKSKAAGFELEWTKSTERLNENGFYLKQGKEYLLWFGVWTELWEAEGFPLAMALQGRSASQLRHLRDAFLSAIDRDTREFGEWTVAPILAEELEGENPANKIWTVLERVFKAAVKSAEDSKQR
jgi:hypothetical protein